MTIEELQSMIESQNATIAELKKLGESAQAEVSKRDQAIAELNKKLGEKPGADYEELKAKAAKAEVLEKEVVQLKGTLTLKELQSKYPRVDFSLVPAGSVQEMETFAAKLDKHIEAQLKAAAPAHQPPTGDQKWGQLPPAAGTSREELTEAQKNEQIKKLDDDMKSGNAKDVLEQCFKLQPKATAQVFQGLIPAGK